MRYIVLWSLTTFRKNRRKYTGLRHDPQYHPLQWTEFPTPRRQRPGWQRNAFRTNQHTTR